MQSFTLAEFQTSLKDEIIRYMGSVFEYQHEMHFVQGEIYEMILNRLISETRRGKGHFRFCDRMEVYYEIVKDEIDVAELSEYLKYHMFMVAYNQLTGHNEGDDLGLKLYQLSKNFPRLTCYNIAFVKIKANFVARGLAEKDCQWMWNFFHSEKCEAMLDYRHYSVTEKCDCCDTQEKRDEGIVKSLIRMNNDTVSPVMELWWNDSTLENPTTYGFWLPREMAEDIGSLLSQHVDISSLIDF